MNPTTEIPRAYDPHQTEDKWYKIWLDRGYFHAQNTSDAEPYSIVIPPPNVTGSLHIGHAMDNTIQDILVRWRRMQGYNALWMPGTDHAGIITQHVMEKQLEGEGTTREKIGREAFLERMWRWKAESRGNIISQLMRLGCSCDWERERFTLDDGLSRAVRAAFVKLYREGLIYRGNYIINWCPRCQTAVSDLEVEHGDEDGHFYHLEYPVKGTDDVLIIATTRPETMLGDTAVAVHPDDERYQHLIGKTAILPIVEREIPIIADEYVDRELGTGALKVTPCHDPNDFEIGLRHGLEQVHAMNRDGTMSELTGKFSGMDRAKCRELILEELNERKQLVRTEDHPHSVGRHERCGTVIEPFVSEQWFMRMQPLAQRAIEAADAEEVRFIPEREEKRFYEWMHGIRDWCLSRQIWWGHRLPVWYCQECEQVVVAEVDPTECTSCGSENLEQDPDVLDTWFSSGLWPFSTMGWPDETSLLKTFYPTSVLVTGWDILFFWVSRMVMLGLRVMDEVPFQTVYLHPLVTDEKGDKMSKSRGNTVDPIASMEKYGTDGFRFALTWLVAPTLFMPLPEDRIAKGREFANKIWNVTRLVRLNLGGLNADSLKPLDLDLSDRWIRSRYNQVIEQVTQDLEAFRFSQMANTLYEFIWHEFCDWYAEMSKLRWSHDDGSIQKHTAQYVASEILEGALRLLHPVMPFITEELWQHLPHEGESIVIAPWPSANLDLVDVEAESAMQLIMDVIDAVRSSLGELGVPASRQMRLLVQASDPAQRAVLEAHLPFYLRAFLRNAEVEIHESVNAPRESASSVVGSVEISIPLVGLIDIEAERQRLTKKHDKAVKDLQSTNRALENPNFVQRAKPEVVALRRQQKDELEAEIVKLSRYLDILGSQ